MSESPPEAWIRAVVPGQSFVDIGGIGEWSCNERVSGAINAGAGHVAMADIQPFTSDYWTFFHNKMAGIGIDRSQYDCHERVDITRSDLPEQLPRFDVLHSTGILYHVADPVTALYNLTRITGQWLITNTVIMPARVENEFGTIECPDGMAFLLPAMSEPQRDIMRQHYKTKFGWSIDDTAPRPQQTGAMMPHRTEQGLSCWPYWWLLSIPAFRALVNVMGFAVRDEYTWEDHAHFLLCERVDPIKD
ncbi:class I SAM-dependent methyltransferase [Belnapia rosea]|uniref:Methyltransferase domain-containing protein n=1 Tax=Belnapia rosea TaxID=938405 RepID=A0A1G6WA47_9PROT|nr:class I SAM-dependent methyltransferase [Belnapia rosea]SDD62097.1 hypothetical protein SAMN04487779_1010105 [Belnapia rosea]